jgi:type VI secretion system protein ImpH
MAGDDRTPSDRLTKLAELESEPYRFGFFGAVRLLDCVFRDSPRTGEALRPGDEPVRIGQDPSMVFSPSTLTSFTSRHGTWNLRHNFFGLFGPNGALPLHLTEYAYERLHREHDETFARFADMFHHRMAALFYRAWANSQPTVSMDRPDQDRFADYVGSLFGIGMDSLQNRDAMPDHAKLHFAGHLACQTCHPDGLRSILEHFFDAPVRILEFVGHWIPLPEDCRFVLGHSPRTGELGISTTIGDRVWDRQQKFRIELGPLSLADYRRFLPGAASLRRLTAVVRNYLGDEWLWDLRLILAEDEIPPFALGQSAQLGWTMWLISDEAEKDSDDLVLNPLAVECGS